MGSYDCRPIYLRNWWACKWLESATMNIVQQSVRYRPSSWINSNMGLSSIRGPFISPPFWVEHPQTWLLPLAHPCPRSTILQKIKCCYINSRAGSFWCRVYTDSEGAWYWHYSLNYRKCPGKKVKNSVGNILKSVHCHFLFPKKKCQAMSTFQRRKRLAFFTAG